MVKTVKERYENKKANLLSDKSICKYNRDLFKEFFEYQEVRLKRIRGNKEISPQNYTTLYAYPRRLKNVNDWFKNKPWNKITKKEIEKIYNDLEDGKITSSKGDRIKDRSKSYYFSIFCSKPFKLAGIDQIAREVVAGTPKDVREVEFVNEEGFRKIISVVSNKHHLLLLWLQWDIGENINSLLKMQKKHFKKRKNKYTREDEYLVYLPKSNLKTTRQMRSEPTIHPETVKYLEMILSDLEEEDFLFKFEYRQALKFLDTATKKSKVKNEPTGNKSSWKDLRSGMACYLFEKGWNLSDINLRLGHTPNSQALNDYINYLAVNRDRAKKELYNTNLEEVQFELEETKRREKLFNTRIDGQSKYIEELESKLSQVLKAVENLEKNKN